MLQVQRISHATFETPDLERQLDYYTNILGFDVGAREKDRVFLKTAMGEHAVTVVRGDRARCTRVAFQINASNSLADLARTLTDHAIQTQRVTDLVPGIKDMLSFLDPKGTTVDVFSDADLYSEDRTPKGITPLKLGHLAFKVQDIQAIVKFYVEILGFRVSDWRQDFFVFMRCGPDHHTVNFAAAEKVKMHHIAFELKDAAEIMRACDFLGRNKYRLIWGPGRHVIGDNIFTYHRDPDGQIVELYTELATMPQEGLGTFLPRPWREDRPYVPTVWGANTLGNLWGPGPPPGFGD
jgi:catechol 2,3-dioxygenase-like lactoylglutathione lyase family enzyme